MIEPKTSALPALSARKRLLDLACATLALILTAPLLLLIALLIRITQPGTVIFSQERHGLHARPFVLYKFRTMKDLKDAKGDPLADHLRITRIGAFLRRSSLDELPELINVLKGDMSIVGPRPLLARYTPYFTAAEYVRFDARPGITGLAQVSGRNKATWDQRLALDQRYVHGWSLSIDAHIIVRTIRAVVSQAGVEALPMATMEDLDVERGENPE